MFLILSQKKFRKVIREEFERFMVPPDDPIDVTSIKSMAGGELIFLNPVREMFDEGRVKSLKDII